MRWGGLRRTVAGVALTALAVGGLSAMTLASPQAADAAVSPSQQWATAISGATANGGTLTTTFGATGVTATTTATGNANFMPQPYRTDFPGNDTNGNSFFSPTAPAGAKGVLMGVNNQQSITATTTFGKPVINPELHVLNIDGSIGSLNATTTSGAAADISRVAGNNRFQYDTSSHQFNNPAVRASNGGCQANDGSNPSGACGTLRMNGLINSFIVRNSDQSLGGDGWGWAVSFPTAPLTKQFSPSRIAPGGTSKLTFTIANPANEAQPTLTPLGFTDNLPAGVTLADTTFTNNGQCGTPISSGLAVGGTKVTADAITVAAGATCTITVNVTASQAGAYTNDNSNLSTTVANLVPNANTTLEVGTPKYTVQKTASTNRATPGSNVTYSVTVTNTGDFAYTADNPAKFTDDLSGVLDDATYNGDASGGATVSGNTLSWSGPLAKGASQTITYSVKVNSPDTGDHTLANKVTPTGDGGTCVTSADCATSTPVADFTVQKKVDRTQVVPGQKVTYTVTVKNTGKADFTTANPAKFTDDLSQVTDDATYNGDATGGATVSGNTLSWSGALATGATQTITYSFTVNDPDEGDAKLINTVVPTGGTCAAPGACTTQVPQGSYTTTKTVNTTAAKAGDTVTYTVTVKNTGSVDYTDAIPATFTDDLSKVLDDATYVDGSATNGATVNANTLTWSGPLAAGATQTVTYQVKVNSPVAGDHKLDNTVTPGENGGRCLTAGDCATSTPIADFTTSKTSTPANPIPGQKVTYTVTVKNTGAVAFTTANPASFSDDMSKVLDDATYNNDATNGATYTAPTLSWQGALGIGDTTTVTYSVTVNSPDTGDKTLTNAVVPGEGGHCTGDCTVTNLVRSYTVEKTASDGPVNPGDTVTYTVTVKNTGAVAYTTAKPATVTDDLSKVLDDATYVDGSATNGAKVSGTTLTWSGPLDVGASETITYQVKAGPAGTGDGTLTNTVKGNSNDGASCATEGGCETTTLLQAFEVVKKADATEVTPGSKITYTITVTNTGKADYTTADPAKFTDDMSKVLDDAAYNNDATNGATYAAPTLSWAGPLKAGEKTTVTYSVTVNDPDTGDKVLDNAVVTPKGGNCPTATTDNPDCRSLVPSGSYTVTKTADTDTVKPGGKVTYTVTVTNTGKTAYTAKKPAGFRDDLTNVLDDATYNKDATQGAKVDGNTLTWSGPLKVGQTVKVTYSVTVNNPDNGNRTLVNAVVPTIDGGGCDPDGSCITHTPVKGFTVTKTVDTTAAVKPGQKVSYTVTVKNTGSVAFTDATPASFTDDMSDVLDDATYNNDATQGAKLQGTTLTWSGPLEVGQIITVTYSVTVKPVGSGNGKLVNSVDPPVDGSCDPAGTCRTDTPITGTPIPATPIVPGIPGLAFTGTELVGPGIGLALMLIALGGALLIVRRRRQHGDEIDNA